MFWLKFLFWLLAFVVFYTYLGYGMLLYLLVRLKRWKRAEVVRVLPGEELPEVTFIVAAWNERLWMEDKIRNCLAFDYPKEKIWFWFVTDGSDDGTPEIIRHFPAPAGVSIRLFHQEERRGKIAAVERIMPLVETPVVIFTDANTVVNREAIRNIVRHYSDPGVGAVAGEKRITTGAAGDAAGAGEGIYWQYESTLKKWDAEWHTAIGAAGELFSIRTALYENVAHDTLIEDFVLTMGIAMKGYRIAYEPGAYAVEGQSASISEELKRKIRIAAGGLQTAWRLRSLLNPFRYGLLSFQYISHRFLRWVVAPLALPVLLVINIVLAAQGSYLYQGLLLGQIVFYVLAFTGYILEGKKLKFKVFFVPYYFCMMNYAMYRGFFRLVSGRQSVVWEKAKRVS